MYREHDERGSVSCAASNSSFGAQTRIAFIGAVLAVVAEPGRFALAKGRQVAAPRLRNFADSAVYFRSLFVVLLLLRLALGSRSEPAYLSVRSQRMENPGRCLQRRAECHHPGR